MAQVLTQLNVEDMLVMGSLRGHPGFDMLLTVLRAREQDLLSILQTPDLHEKDALGHLAHWRAYRTVLGIIDSIFAESDEYMDHLESMGQKAEEIPVPENNPYKILSELQSLGTYTPGDD